MGRGGGGDEQKAKTKWKKKKQRLTLPCITTLKIGQLPLEEAIILHRASLSSFPPAAKHTGLNTLTSEDLPHLKVAAIPRTVVVASATRPQTGQLLQQVQINS